MIGREEIERRSVLMRLWSAHRRGEGYPAHLVNGAAPNLIKKGYIVREGDMYRLTASGVQHWAEISTGALGRQQEDTKQARMLRAIASGELDLRCEVDGCDRPRKFTEKGKVLTMCEEHEGLRS